jgi:AcrR family transcriptional regulator
VTKSRTGPSHRLSANPGAHEPRWRARTADRATQDLRKRAESRSGQFLEIALDLLSEGGADNLSVRKVVEMSDMSLRSFYQLFGGKDDLFLAIYEEAILGALERQMAAVAAEGKDPLGRLRAFLEAEWIANEESSPMLRRSLVIYHQRLMETRPAELAAVLEPQHKALTELVGDCRAAGLAGPALDDSATASLLLHFMITTLQARVLDFHLDGGIDFDQVWAMIVPGFTSQRT